MTLGVLFVLVGLALPALRGAQRSSRGTACLARLRENGVLVGFYMADSRDAWPYGLSSNFVDPYAGRRVVLDSPYKVYGYSWWMSGMWQGPMLAEYYNNSAFDARLYCPSSGAWRETLMATPRDSHARPWGTDYDMSMAMYLTPRALDPKQPLWNVTEFRGMRGIDVLYPSQKASLLEKMPSHDPGATVTPTHMSAPPYRLNVLACDGSGALRDQAKSIPGVVFPFSHRGEDPVLDATSSTFSHTPRGVHGRDW